MPAVTVAQRQALHASESASALAASATREPALAREAAAAGTHSTGNKGLGSTSTKTTPAPPPGAIVDENGKVYDSYEAYLRSPFGSAVPLTSYSGQGRQFRDHALDMVLGDRQRQAAAQDKIMTRRQRAWALRFLAELSGGDDGASKNGRSKTLSAVSAVERLPGYVRAGGGGPNAQQGLKHSHGHSTSSMSHPSTSSMAPPPGATTKHPKNLIEQGLLDPHADPESHGKYTNGSDNHTHHYMRRGKGKGRHLDTDATLHHIEAKARAKALSAFLQEHSSITREEAEAKLTPSSLAFAAKRAAGADTGPDGSTITQVVLLKLRNQSVVTGEMIRVLFYSLDCIVDVSKVWFTPPRDECYVKFSFDIQSYTKTPYRGTHMHIPMIQDLINEMTREDHGTFFGSEGGQESEDQYAFQMRAAIKIGLRHAQVCQSSCQQMQAEIARWTRRLSDVAGEASGKATKRQHNQAAGGFQLQWPDPKISHAEEQARIKHIQDCLLNEGCKVVQKGQKQPPRRRERAETSPFLTSVPTEPEAVNGVAATIASKMTWMLTTTMEQQQQEQIRGARPGSKGDKAESSARGRAWLGADSGRWHVNNQ